MIKYSDYKSIDREVRLSVIEAFEYIQTQSKDDFILFLADGEYKKNINNPFLNPNPYAIGDIEDRIKDESRLKFLVHFMDRFYSFPKGIRKTVDDEFRIHVELMIYTHIWESKPFLKQLFRIAALADTSNYPWKFDIPDMRKHDFIRNSIRNKLSEKGLKLANTISNGFHTSLRNAFAHSEYFLYNDGETIHLDTYKGDDSWDMPKVSYNDWTKRFLYSTLLTYYLILTKQEKRKSLEKDFGTNEFLITHPINKKKSRIAKIKYYSESDIFGFQE